MFSVNTKNEYNDDEVFQTIEEYEYDKENEEFMEVDEPSQIINSVNDDNQNNENDFDNEDDFISLQFINPKEYTQEEYFNLCFSNLKKSPDDFSFVKYRYLTKEQFLELAKFAIKADYTNFRVINSKFHYFPNGKDDYKDLCIILLENKDSLNYDPLKFINSKYLELLDYLKIIFQAMNIWVGNLEFIDKKIFAQNKNLYLNLVSSLLDKSEWLLEKIDIDLLPNGKYDYIVLSKKVIKNNYFQNFNLYYVNPKNLSQKEYFNLCLYALKKDNKNFSEIKPEFLTQQQYLYLTAIIAEKDDFHWRLVEYKYLPPEFKDLGIISTNDKQRIINAKPNLNNCLS